MHFRKYIYGLLLMMGLVSQSFSSIVGLWETIDDRTGNKKAVVKIYKKDKHYFADIVKVYWKPQDSKICQHCKDTARKNKPIEGMNFLWDLKKKSQSLWDDGRILDPHTGQIYHVRLKKNKNKLYVRAFLGMPLIGRTQEWHRYQP